MKLKIKDPQFGVKSCDLCSLSCFKALSWGSSKPGAVFIGMNPAQSISEHRLCFQSKGFKNFFQAMKELKKDPKDHFYTNLIRCPTPGNRKPKKTEIVNCKEFLQDELDRVKPLKVICFGKIVGKQFGVSEFYTGLKPHKLNDRVYYMFPHPSYVDRFPKEYEKFKKYLELILK